jgi:SagB-type dehydrogenase family enzyme
MESWELASAYHQATKHHFDRAARSLGYLDWANQPDPFRRFHDAPLVKLPLTADDPEPAFDALFEPGGMPPRPVNLETLSAFLELSLGLSAWKEFQGSRWALRINPSSGNLHPTEGYLVIDGVDGIHDAPGVYHYAPKEHALERRTEFPPDVWARLSEGFPRSALFAGLSSIHWREAWKYGERAYRYCHHDVGHALAALSYSAAVQGWETRLLSAAGDTQVSNLLGLDRAGDFEGAEREHPDLLIAVIPVPPATNVAFRVDLSPDAVAQVARGSWCGHANRLSGDRVDWELIDAVGDACTKPATSHLSESFPLPSIAPPQAAHRPPVSAREIIRQRRSAVAMDGKTSITADQFFLMLDRACPRGDRVPFKTLGPPACVHLGLFVHRVEGLSPGLYFLVRSPEQLSKLRAAMRSEFLWEKPGGCPDSLPLYHLLTGDCRQVAGQVSCGQSIAAQSAFSLGMIAEFEEPLRQYGGWFYRRLFWETGVIGQVLYLEAEAAGVRGTGIGCFFDDPVHELFGLKDTAYQSLYHFTVGGPVEDARLTTLPPYPSGSPVT